jgi:hypothetical protein
MNHGDEKGRTRPPGAAGREEAEAASVDARGWRDSRLGLQTWLCPRLDARPEPCPTTGRAQRGGVREDIHRFSERIRGWGGDKGDIDRDLASLDRPLTDPLIRGLSLTRTTDLTYTIEVNLGWRITITEWQRNFPEFSASVGVGKAKRLKQWESAAMQGAFTKDGGNATLIIFGLKNAGRAPAGQEDEWAEKTEVAHSGAIGHYDPSKLTDEELQRIVDAEAILAVAVSAGGGGGGTGETGS